MQRSSRLIRPVSGIAVLCLVSGLAACGSEAATNSTGTTGGVIIPIEEATTTSTSTSTSTRMTAPAVDSVSAAPAESAVPPTNGVPAAGAAPAAAVAPASSATVPATSAAPSAAPGDCLVGNWSVAPGDVATYLDRSASSVFEDVVASGQLNLSFTASGYTWTQSARVAFTVAYDTGPTPATFSVDRTLTGSWVATATTISATDLEFDGDFTITENGVEPEDTGDLFLGVIPFDPVDGMSYSCDGPTINLRVNDFGSDSMPVTLRPS